ncbi:hypothetical protein ACRRTK_003711 [Alexandromys fortis]
MTKVPQGFDFSFLNEEEARKILQVLERNEELRRAEKDRIRASNMALSRAVGVHMLSLTQKLPSFGVKCDVGYTFLTDTLH